MVTPAGADDSLWRPHLDRLPRRRFDELAGRLGAASGAHLLAVSAHPDDETLGGGRFIADWVRAGGRVSAVTATAGEACFDEVGHHFPALAQTRLREWRDALQVLGVEPLRCLDLPDGGVGGHLASLREQLREMVDDVQPDVIAGTLDCDPHPDHAAVGAVVRAVAANAGVTSLEWPIWLAYFGTPPAPEGLEVIECSQHAESIRAAAWECFTSQREPVSDDLTAVVPEELVAMLREQLIVERSAG